MALGLLLLTCVRGDVMELGQETQFLEFYELCKSVEAAFDREWRNSEEWEREEKLIKEKRAIMGYEEECQFYKDKIRTFLEIILNDKKVYYPPWYMNLEEGIFAELYGFAGLSPWIYDQTEEYKESSSAKLIGDRLYCLINGKSKLQPQRIGSERRNQLKRALLMATPEERIEKGFHEIYLHNGIRISIFSGEKTKENEDIMVFRKYLLKELTLEKLVELGTIPADSVELFKIMIKLGFNVIFAGQVRTGKTSFMQCWQRYEDPTLEGMSIATDPETPWHKIMPDAPIMQITADGRELLPVSKALLRGDNDYILLEEMRDAHAYKLALDITSIGATRSKATIHAGDANDIPYKMATAILAEFGGDYKGILCQIFKNWHFVFEFFQDHEDRSKKKLKSISEYRYNIHKDLVSIHTICKYDFESRKWKWKWDIGEDKVNMSKIMPEEFKKMKNMVKMLESRNPIMENTVVYPRYYKSEGEYKDVR